jgi:predicted metalloprotease with PDZ domain
MGNVRGRFTTFRLERPLRVIASDSLLLALLCCAPASANAQAPASAQTVEYVIAFPNAVHHEAQVTAIFRGAQSTAPLQVRMARSSPGRYALHEFAKNVYGVSAVDGGSKALTVTRPNEHSWSVAGHDGTVRITYTLFADHADGTYPGIDATHAHLQMPGVFMYAPEFDAAPVRITFELADPRWKIATQLFPTPTPNVFTAPGLQYFMDSPTEISNFSLREWPVSSSADPQKQTIRMAVHHLGTEAQVDSLETLVRRIVAEEAAVFGEFPKYDTGNYTFEIDYLPWVFGDGMEHRNSTTVTGTRPLTGAGIAANTGTIAHEYFHSWNMERIRAKAIEPFAFDRANMSSELWFGEGFTSYYDALIRTRAGIYRIEDFATEEGGNLSFVLNAPGRKLFSAAEMSMQAPFVDAAASIDATNRQNTFISYYSFGEALALGLDLTLRARFGRTLDDFMRAMWLQHGRTEMPYTTDDLRHVLGTLTGDQSFADDYFRRYVNGREAVDYEGLLGRAGLLLRKRLAGQAALTYARIAVDDAGAVRVASGTLAGDPFYLAGIDDGDRIISINDAPVAAAQDLQTVLSKHKPGDSVRVTFEQRGVTRTATVTLQERNDLEIVPYESAGRSVTPEMRGLRASWLGAKAAQGT